MGATKKKDKGSSEKKVEEEPFVNTTPVGEKKDIKEPLRKSYHPPAVEAAWYDWWKQKGYFTADNKSEKEKFVIMIPPPNVTGSLHMGHALTNSVQDTIVRWNRMKGKNVLWVPGLDHAGIATQTVVERRLWKDSQLSRHELGREKFIEKVWQWKEEYGGRILKQLERLGSSVDWSRLCFTMDDKLSKAVTEAFVRMFEDGIIYRDKKLVNWCCRLNTTISDIEVDFVELEKHTKMNVPGYEPHEKFDFGMIVEFAYKVEGSDEEVVIATTRPETMLGDTAVAVHPDDPRYKHLHGKYLIHPFHDRKLPIITDSELVDMQFGTGAVKITPAHDPNDYNCGKKHNLQFINILNDDGTLNEEGGPFKGMKRFHARTAVISALKEKGLYKGMKDNPMSIATCSRSKDIIEPLIKPQWWVNCKSMAAAAVEKVKNEELQIIPSFHKPTWYRWLENIRDWCISRQLWWGHRVPAWLVCFEGEEENWEDPSGFIVARNEEEAMQRAKEKYPGREFTLKQDPDVLDTWFSSGLFPFSTMGWPGETEDLKAFYPNSLLETGHDILFFWVARMVMMGLHLTGKLPFNQVLLHAMVRDAHGRKMSKTLGNVIDPIDMIEGISLEGLHQQLYNGNLAETEIKKAIQGQKKDFPNGIPECGTDAVRFALCAYTTQGRDINLDVNRVAGYRNFCNKLWNAVKFALMNLGEEFSPSPEEPASGITNGEKWILSRLNNAVSQVDDGFKIYDFAKVTNAVYSFWLYDLCDVYLEMMKPLLYSADPTDAETKKLQDSARQTLYTCLDNGLRLLHPFMPFVTEELWQRLPKRDKFQYESIMISPYPEYQAERANQEIEDQMKIVKDIIHVIRSLRTSFNLTKTKPKVYIGVKNDAIHEILVANYSKMIEFMGQVSDLEFTKGMDTPAGCAVEVVNQFCDVFMQVRDLVDVPKEIAKFETKCKKLSTDKTNLTKRMQSPNYQKVPANVQEENTKKLQTLNEELNAVERILQSLKNMQ